MGFANSLSASLPLTLSHSHAHCTHTLSLDVFSPFAPNLFIFPSASIFHFLVESVFVSKSMEGLFSHSDKIWGKPSAPPPLLSLSLSLSLSPSLSLSQALNILHPKSKSHALSFSTKRGKKVCHNRAEILGPKF